MTRGRLSRRGSMARFLGLGLLALALAPGCSYCRNRARDFLDSFQLSVDAGLGLGADARVGPVGLGSGYWTGYCAGLQRKGAVGVWRETSIGFPVTQVIGAWRFLDAEYFEGITAALTFLSASWVEHRWVAEAACGTSRAPSDLPDLPLARYHLLAVMPDFVYPSEPRRRRECWTDACWIEASVRACLGVRAGFNPAEFLDFLLGFFGLDIAQDDEG